MDKNHWIQSPITSSVISFSSSWFFHTASFIVSISTICKYMSVLSIFFSVSFKWLFFAVVSGVSGFYRYCCQVIKMRIILGRLLKIHAFHCHLFSSGVRFFLAEVYTCVSFRYAVQICVQFVTLVLCCAVLYIVDRYCGSFSICSILSPRAKYYVWKEKTQRSANKPKWYHHWVFQQIVSV